VPWRELGEEHRRWVLDGEGRWEDGLWYGVKRFFDWLEGRSYRMHIRVLLSRYRAYRLCPACGGARLKPDALLWRLGPERLTIHDVALLPIERCRAFFDGLTLPGALDEAGALLLREIRARLGYLVEVGLGYLTLDRQSRTLSGGEAQRINLTTALGTSLVNTLFVLDEPSIGLHPRDIGRLIRILHRLRDAGNSLLVVEHDPEVIRAADRVLDLGPGPGERGGEVVYFGSLAGLRRTRRSLTGDYLAGRRRVAERPADLPPPAPERCLRVLGAAQHNLKRLDVTIPLDRLVCVTGVSGSGKSTLVEDVLYPALRKLKHQPSDPPGRHREILGHEPLAGVVLVDQSPIGKTARSNPASYVGALDAIRRLFAAEPLARERGYGPGTFSFNAGNGRCPTCAGSGFEHVEMQFLSDVYLRCPDCEGRRYRAEILEVRVLPPAPDDRVKEPNPDGRDGARSSGIRGQPPVCGTGGTTSVSSADSLSTSADEARSGAGAAGLRRARSIAEVLALTVNEACEFFAAVPEVVERLAPVREVGLGYLALGQPVPTLSGGEAQRLKLAGHLARARGGNRLLPVGDRVEGDRTPPERTRDSREPATRNHEPGTQNAPALATLFLFDEPTTGLHFDDIATLLRALRRLLAQGHAVVVIEHNLDVVRAADWIVDLGPEGGEAGGEVVCAGPPDTVRACPRSHTGAALRAAEGQGSRDEGRGARGEGTVASTLDTRHLPPSSIRIHNAREHNLKNIDIAIPRDRLTVITGVSGSGKSTLAFDILFAEGQRRYLESLNAYARQFVQPAARPDVDAISGIPPTVAIEQRTSRGGRKSTVATVTEIHHFLRLLFVKLGVQHCPECRVPIRAQTPEGIVARVLHEFRGRRVSVLAPLVVARKGLYNDLAAWAAGRGYERLRVDGAWVPTRPWARLDRYREHTIELPVGDGRVTPSAEPELRRQVEQALALGKGVAYVAPFRGGGVELDAGRQAVFSVKRACPRCGRGFAEPDPRLFSYNSRHGWCPRCYGTGQQIAGFDADQTGEEIWWNEWWEGPERACPACEGRRLRPEALAVRFLDRSIADFASLSVAEAARFFRNPPLTGRAAAIARDVLPEIRARLAFLLEVGLPYLTLDRGAPTLSGGEARRIRLAAQLGSNLRGVCYILDEPTIGLHAHDNAMLLGALDRLKAKGNTVVVVEHDEQTIRRAEHVIDLGPGGGVGGGHVVAAGTVTAVERLPESVTGRFLRRPLRHPLRPGRRRARGSLEVVGATLHNLRNLRLRVPLGSLVCVTGVSGSGKSTLVRDVLYTNLRRRLGERRTGEAAPWQGCRELRGLEGIRRALEVDQTPIGKTPRSCPATYVGFWDDVRRLFATTPEARLRGYGPGRFSFNVRGGRCEACEGQGVKTIAMSFLPDVTVPCEACGGARFAPETLEARYRDKTVAEVLAMSVDEAVGFFEAHRSIHHALRLLQDVGLGYLTLGQPSPTLSGGEAQRIKLVTELAKSRPSAPSVGTPGSRTKNHEPGTQNRSSAGTLYLLDEPTIGLHMGDVERLVHVLHRLVDAGNTLVIIEHNLDVIAEADWIIDLGPEGGDRGGRIVAQGTPEEVARRTRLSHTARFLAPFLRRAAGPTCGVNSRRHAAML
jgi:excinuclease ABC subunit A